MNKSMRLFVWSGLVFLVAVGCSGDPPLVAVKGKLTMKGKPLGNVKVDFHPDPDKGTRGGSSTATTDKDGNFTLSYKPGTPGAVVGHHRILLTDLDIFGNVFVGRGDYRSEEEGKKREVPKKPRFPVLYTNLNDSPFRVEVKVGMEPVELEIK